MQQNIAHEMIKIRQNLQDSVFSLLLPDHWVRQKKSLFLPVWQEMTHRMLTLLMLSTEVAHVTLPLDVLAPNVQESNVLFVGPFTVISSKHFFYKRLNSHVMEPAAHSSSFGLFLQAYTAYHNQNGNTLWPIDPLYGHVLLNHIKQPNIWNYLAQRGMMTWSLLFLGLLSMIWILIKIFMIFFASLRLSNTQMDVKKYSLKNPLCRMLHACRDDARQSWMNVMHHTLSKERETQYIRECWLVRWVIVLFSVGIVLTMVSVVKALYVGTITSSALVHALIPCVMSLAIGLILIIENAFLVIVHRLFLIKFEEASWKLLSEKNNHGA